MTDSIMTVLAQNRQIKSVMGGGGGGGGGQRPILPRSKKCPVQKMTEHGTKVGHNGTFFPGHSQ